MLLSGCAWLVALDLGDDADRNLAPFRQAPKRPAQTMKRDRRQAGSGYGFAMGDAGLFEVS
jgi:hypothetical protein